MRQYPSIPRWSDDMIGERVYVVDKLDGSNIRAEWNGKKGFYKFGSRNHLIDEKDPQLGQAVTLVQDRYGKILSGIASSRKWESAVFFFEFCGPGSFAGSHLLDDEKSVTLIDANIFKKGHMTPDELVSTFGRENLPKVIYDDVEFDRDIVQDVENGTLLGMTFEGVICRSSRDKDLLFKVKNRAWLDKLKQKCGDDAQLYQRLM